MVAVLIGRTGGVDVKRPRDRAAVFADLNPAEMVAVRNYLWSKKKLDLKPANETTMAKNSVFLIETRLPRKDEVLNFLDKNGSLPTREARVIIFFGARKPPRISEYTVGPLPRPSYLKQVVPVQPAHIPTWTSRPVSAVEHMFMDKVMKKATEPLYRLLVETTGFWFHNCTDRCLVLSDVGPRGVESGQRRTWFIVQRLVEGLYLHPIGLELQLNHKDSDPESWRVEQVWFQGQYFSSPQDLARWYATEPASALKLEELPLEGDGDTEERPLFSSYRPRGSFPNSTLVKGPRLIEPQGHRYRVEGNAVVYGGWSFAFRLRSSIGLQLLDLRFGGERVAYEVSVQESASLYGGHTPAGMQSNFMDSGYGMGSSTFELAPGIDCPERATFLDAHHYYDADAPVLYRCALCIFEMPTGVPLRRHFDSNFRGGYKFYAGLEGQALVVRTITTVYSYDYIWDFVFHHNGVMEAKMQATGYIYSTFYMPDGLRYGTRLHTHLLGNVHTHLVHYRVDLDVAGTQNSFETLERKLEKIANPWSPGHQVLQPTLERMKYSTERQAAIPTTVQSPGLLLFTNQEKNRWGHPRSYRLQLTSVATPLWPGNWKEEQGITWARYQLAVTTYQESELRSSSIFNQNDPWHPPRVFEDFLSNDENIENKDLVAWVTVGFLHVPHSEEVPNTATPGNSVGFLLRPFNFFPEDPSLASRDAVIVRPQPSGPPFIQRWTPDVVGTCGPTAPFSYDGTYLPV
ncbi:amiloride-sensitive amine oxidase [copper-containing] isoform X2 [Ornithorhynchus anatinus]|uniref:amiloride-sensitive amine oxidase [copper-containing] isoform X2 n=1 Tax=Ornithorhynchus anatinus TaxID=9258 RepID=UPI0019D43F54|nr:amiloride-sensitive amine oxidase [copper-containing] isoform X2 [Ornithorhynchus anatinus]